LYSPLSLLSSMRATFPVEADVEDVYALERAALRHAHVVTSPSRELAGRTRTFFGLEREVAFVPNPLDTDLFRPAERPPHGLRVCFAGRLEARKGITTLFEAIPAVLAGHPGVEFHIIGEDVHSFRSLYGPRLGPDRIRFQGPVPLAELPAVYQGASLS